MRTNKVTKVIATVAVLFPVALAYNALTASPAPSSPTVHAVAVAAAPQAVEEDDPRWKCAENGNRICGPGNSNGAPAGCYQDGQLVIPWTYTDEPQRDPLWAVGPKTPGKRDYPTCSELLAELTAAGCFVDLAFVDAVMSSDPNTDGRCTYQWSAHHA